MSWQRFYYEVPEANELTGINAEIAAKMQSLLQQPDVVIAEVGFVFENCFCCVDILRKTGFCAFCGF